MHPALLLTGLLLVVAACSGEGGAESGIEVIDVSGPLDASALDFMRTAMADQALTVHGQTLPAGKTRAILQSDLLHPTPHGVAWLALGILDAVVTKLPAFPANDVRWNAGEVFQIGSQSALPKPSPQTSRPTPEPAAQ